MRVMCSGWLKRLWTLQEASLAMGPDEDPEADEENGGTLYIQMGDGPAHWNRHARHFEYMPPGPSSPPPREPSPIAVSVQEAKTDLVYGMHLLTAIEDRLPSAPAIQEPRFDTRFEKIKSAVQNRSTSKREDEAVCMASLLAVDLKPILDLDNSDERMVKFYRLLYELPTAILFAEFGIPGFLSGNLARAPYRWAPRSLLLLERPMEINLATSAMRFADPPLPLLGRCEDDGLHIEHPGFVFESDRVGAFTVPRESLLLDTNDGGLYSLSLGLSDRSPQTLGPVQRCALVFKTGICSDVLIVALESEVAALEEESRARFCVTIIGHGSTVRPTPAANVLSEGDGMAELETRPLVLLVWTPRDGSRLQSMTAKEGPGYSST
ncbi:hypothetical protein C8Q80DRAFT_1153080 [Daedaleopsis nitida]|nr:hypothetical protein C8Q80DRAFT_1153080 [Daedaleopsis nitida]